MEASSQPVAAPVGIQNQAAGIGAFSAAPTIVFNPAQTDTRDVNSYNTLSEACSTLKSVGTNSGMSGPRTLAIRYTSETLTFNTAGTYDPGPEATWDGSNSGVTGIEPFTMTWENGTVPTIPAGFHNISIKTVTASAGAFCSSSQSGPFIIYLDNTRLQGFSAAKPVIDLTSTSSITLILERGSVLTQYAFVGGSNINVALYNDCELQVLGVPTSASVNVLGSGVVVDPSFYATTIIGQGVVYADASGTAVTTMPPNTGALLLDLTTGILYQGSDNIDPIWLPIGLESIVFQPGGEVAAGVVTIESTLLALLKTLALNQGSASTLNGSPTSVFFDLSQSSSPYTLTETGYVIGPNCTWTDGGQEATLVGAPGTFTDFLPSLEGTLIVENGASGSLYAPAAAGTCLTYIRGQASYTTTAAGASIYDAATSANNMALSLILQDQGGVASTAGTALTNATGTGSITVTVEDGGQLGANSLANSGGTVAFATILSPGAVVAATNFPFVKIQGLWTDPTATAESIIVASSSTGAALISNGHLYQSIAGVWHLIA
jgi:hypothetical protein